MAVSGLGEVAGLCALGVLFVEAVDHGAGHVGIQLDEYGWLPRWIHVGGDRARLVDAAVAEPLFDCFSQVAGEPERSLVLVAEVPHGDLRGQIDSGRCGTFLLLWAACGGG